MYAGRIVEAATTGALFRSPRHPYTAALLAAVPRLHGDAQRRLAGISGDPPQPSERPAGCAFAPRCARAEAQCRTLRPLLRASTPGAGQVACHLPLPAVPGAA
jgi:oligopeptide/dipeptide ABC transporter ATP-binding protein